MSRVDLRNGTTDRGVSLLESVEMPGTVKEWAAASAGVVKEYALGDGSPVASAGYM